MTNSATNTTKGLKMVLAAASAVVALLGAEVAARLLGISEPRTSERHEHRGTVYRPNIEWIQSDEGYAHVRTNSAGFRDGEWTTSKTDGTYRIAVIGDSYVAAVQVAEERRFTERLDTALDSCAGTAATAFEVLNFGKPGYGTAEELLTFRHSVVQYKPDLVLLAFLPHNDVRNNLEALQQDPGRPYFVLRDHELTLDNSFRDTSFHRQSWWKRLANWGNDRSVLLQVATRAGRTWLRGRDRNRLGEGEKRMGTPTEPPIDLAPNREELGLDDRVYVEPKDAIWEEAWQVTEAILSAMHFEVESVGARFMVATLSSGRQVHPDPEVRRRFREALDVDTLLYPDERVRQLGERAGFPVLNLAETFQYKAKAENRYFHGFENPGSGHWNEQGHELAAQLLAPAVCDMLAGTRSKEHVP